MPLKSGYSHQTFSANLAELIRAGHERNSAIMAAASKARQSFFKRFPAGALPNWLAFPKTARTVNHYDGGGRPLMHNPKNKVFGYEWEDIQAMQQKRGSIHKPNDLSKAGDYGADPLGDGMFRMVPSGDIVDFAERNRRLAKRNPRIAEPDQRAVAKAADLYEGFTGKPPRKIRKLPVKALPQAALAIGKVFGIMYSVDATGERFHHEFKRSAQPLLIVSPDGQQVFLHGGAYTFTKRGFVDH